MASGARPAAAPTPTYHPPPPRPAQSREAEPRVALLLKMMLWAQERLDERAVYPKITDLGNPTAQAGGGGGSGGSGGGGGGAQA